MAKIVFRQEAIDDLSDIWNYTIEKWSVEQADKYYFLIKSACRDLAKGKFRGKSYKEISSDVLGFNVGKHIIFYKHHDTGIFEVVRILHQSMDLNNRLTN